MEELKKLLLIIETNFKGQFMVHEIYTTAKLVSFSLEKNKPEMAQGRLNHLYSLIKGESIVNGKLVTRFDAVFDVTGVLDKFMAAADKLIKAAK